MKLIAHRGIHSKQVPENSKPAIAACVGSVADGIEIDVRLSRDGICIVNHDTKLVSGHRITKHTSKQLENYHPDIVSVSQALEELKGFNGLINLEVKHLFFERGAKQGIACIEKLANDIHCLDEQAQRQIVVSTFSSRNMDAFSRFLPSISRAYLAPMLISYDQIIKKALETNSEAIHLSLAHLKSKKFSKLIQMAKEHSLLTRVYTVNLDHEYDLANENGVDAVFTDQITQMFEYRKNSL